jgi:hypothetical protein
MKTSGFTESAAAPYAQLESAPTGAAGLASRFARSLAFYIKRYGFVALTTE